MSQLRSLFVAMFPAVLLTLGSAGVFALGTTAEMQLAQPFSGFPRQLEGYELGDERVLSGEELSVLAPDAYLARRYVGGQRRGWDLFVAYYGRQESGSTIHSPRNCLPGSGWKPVRHDRVDLRSVLGSSSINRYVVERESGERALVYYWYQGRGRIESSEYRVKWDLVRDAIVRRRTDETLVRIVLPLRRNEDPEQFEDRALLESVADALQPHLPG
jgi:EpsI family protein